MRHEAVDRSKSKDGATRPLSLNGLPTNADVDT